MSSANYKLAWYSRKVRIGIIGAYASGKTSFIKRVSEIFDSITTKRYVKDVGLYESTLAYDYGLLYALRSANSLEKVSSEEALEAIENGSGEVYRVELWGAAGQKHLFAARQAIIYPKIDGVILFFDPSRENSFELSLLLYREAKDNVPGLGEVKPVIVVFNKLDLVPLEKVRRLAERIVKFLDEDYVEGENMFFISVKMGWNVWRPVEAFIRKSKV